MEYSFKIDVGISASCLSYGGADLVHTSGLQQLMGRNIVDRSKVLARGNVMECKCEDCLTILRRTALGRSSGML
jgi:hypothetical protein